MSVVSNYKLYALEFNIYIYMMLANKLFLNPRTYAEDFDHQ
jgi:hypothetical protein